MDLTIRSLKMYVFIFSHTLLHFPTISHPSLSGRHTHLVHSCHCCMLRHCAQVSGISVNRWRFRRLLGAAPADWSLCGFSPPTLGFPKPHLQMHGALLSVRKKIPAEKRLYSRRDFSEGSLRFGTLCLASLQCLMRCPHRPEKRTLY